MAVSFKQALGTGQATSSGTTITITTTAAIAIGDLVVVRWASDNLNATTPTATCADGGNTYTVLRQAAVNATAAAGVAGGMLATKATVARASGSTITVTLSGSVAHKCAYAESFTGAENTLRGTAVGATGTATAASAGLSATASAGDLVLGHLANETRGTITGDSDTTGGIAWSTQVTHRSATSGSDATCVSVAGQYKILTGVSGGQTYNVTAVAAEWVCQCVVLQATPEATITQAAYQFFDDAGTESGATSLGAVNTAITGDISNGDGVGALRIRVQSTNAGFLQASDDYQLQWEKNVSGTWVDVQFPVFDSYGETNYVGNHNLYVPSQSGEAQSFLGNGQLLQKAGFWIAREGSVAGNVTAQLFAHTGTFGTSSAPTGTALAISDPIAGNAIGTSFGWVDFTFATPVLLGGSTSYCIALMVEVGAPSNDIMIGYDSTSPTHGGNAALASSGGTVWTPNSTRDLIFRVWEVPSSAVVSYDNPNLTGGAVTTNRLGAGTGSFVAGEVCEDGHVDNLALTQNNYTEILYSLKIVAADFVHGDTLRFRILRNGVTTGVTYSQTPTINIIRSAANVAATISSSWGTWTGAADGSVTTPTANIVASISTNWSGEVLHAWFGADPADTFSQPPYELGTKFTVSTPTSCVGIRIRNPGTTWAGAADGRYARLWDGVTQAQLKTLNIVETMPSGWSEYLWDAPVALEAAHEYIVSHNVSTEGMCATTHLLDTSVTSGPVTLIMGQFDNNPGVFPATVYQNSFYGVDVLYGGTGRGWTATAAGTVSGPAITDHPGTIASAWGTWTATAAGTVVAEVITGTITTTWGTWTATAAGTVVAEVITGTVTTAWGTWTATSIAIRLAYAGISTLWGTWTGSAAGSVGTPAGWSIPPNVLATTTGPSTITVTWDDVPAATGYDVERNGTVIVYNHPDSPYNDSGLNSDTLYSYRVRAVG